jgi:hypothetical protein
MKFKKVIKTINKICNKHNDCEYCPFCKHFVCIAKDIDMLEVNSNEVKKICKEYLKNNKKG